MPGFDALGMIDAMSPPLISRGVGIAMPPPFFDLTATSPLSVAAAPNRLALMQQPTGLDIVHDRNALDLQG